MQIAIWSEEYETGYPLVDQQHKNLFDMINSYHTAINSDHETNKISSILNDLALYTQSHFRTEESLMVSSGYPDIAKHKQLHNNLISKVNELINEFQTDKTLRSTQISAFLADWLRHHIKKEDMLLIQWVRLHA